MILEVAVLYVAPDKQDSFEEDFRVASKYISAISGYRGHSLRKCVEDKKKYMLLVNWDSLEDHTIGFRQSAGYIEWKRLLHHYYDPFPVVEHFTEVCSFE